MEQYERNVTAYIGRGVDGCEVQEQNPLDNGLVAVALDDRLFCDPLEYVILVDTGHGQGCTFKQSS